MTIRLPLGSRPFCTVSSADTECKTSPQLPAYSSQAIQLGRIRLSVGMFCQLPGTLRCSVAGKCPTTKSTYAVTSCCRNASSAVGSATGILERVSAIFRSFPGTGE